MTLHRLISVPVDPTASTYEQTPGEHGLTPSITFDDQTGQVYIGGVPASPSKLLYFKPGLNGTVTTVANDDTAEHTLFSGLQLPANELVGYTTTNPIASQIVKITASGVIDNSSNVDLILRLYFGLVKVAQINQVGFTGFAVSYRMATTIQSVPAPYVAGYQYYTSTVSFWGAGTSILLDHQAPNLLTETSLVVKLTAQWSSNVGSASIELDSFIAEKAAYFG